MRSWAHARACSTRIRLTSATPEALAACLNAAFELRPFEAVINASAYTAVDQAESEEKLAWLINADSPGAIARWCATKNLPWFIIPPTTSLPATGKIPGAKTTPPAP
jgi:dTDP-4-dehydrorhamnose reductase